MSLIKCNSHLSVLPVSVTRATDKMHECEAHDNLASCKMAVAYLGLWEEGVNQLREQDCIDDLSEATHSELIMNRRRKVLDKLRELD